MPNTIEQQLAIDTIDRNVSVSAGAGSGKTAVLKQRFLRILEAARSAASEEDFVKASNIVGITFTRKAAGEIKSRIRGAMLEAMNNGDEDFWRMQLKELEKASVSTIHGLCSKILRENPVEANLDPSFLIEEEFDYDAFKDECIHNFLRKELAENEENSAKILTAILGVSSFQNQLASLTEVFEDIAKEEDLTAPYRDSYASLPIRIKALKNKMTWLVENRDDLVKKTTKAYKSLEEMGSDLPEIFSKLDEDPCDLSLADQYLSLRPSGNLTAEINEARTLSTAIKTCLVDGQAIPLMEHWQNFVNGLNLYINERKEAENILTYDDLETKTIELLSRNEEIRHKYHKKFKYLMVDEFQDTNDKQCELIYLLCGDSTKRLEGNKLFVVGDPKQSIYRFRGADVGVFASVQKQIKAAGGKNISMRTNFRSKDKILDCCNETFDKIMGQGNSSVEFEALDCADFNKDYDVLPELIMIDPEDEDARGLELCALAQKIKALAKDDFASENYLPGQKVYGDMAILLRSMTHISDLTQVLADYNIPYVVIDGKGFYQRQEICDILNLWDVLNNPYQNIPLAAVLKSPYFAFDDELLTKIALLKDYLWDALADMNEDFLMSLSDGHLSCVYAAIQKLRNLNTNMQCLGAEAAWTMLWQLFDVDAVLSVQINGKQKLANVKKLRKLSLEYCNEHGVGIVDWLDYVKSGRANGMKETNANLEAVDAVQIMTIHKSKGLEFKRVLLPFLGAKAHTDSRAIVYSKGIGLGIQLNNPRGEAIKTSVFTTIKDEERFKEREERQRVLYVGMTRAEAELYMFGIPAKNQKEFDEANWMDQLSLIYNEYPGVATRVFSRDDVEETVRTGSVKSYEVEEIIKERMKPLPNYFASGRKLFTASALSTYIYCPRQYFYSEFMDLPILEEKVIDGDNTLSATTMGSIIHETLENYNGKDNLVPVFKAAVKKYAPNGNTERAWNILLGYVNSELYKSIPLEQEREKGFLLEAEDGLVLNGFIDVLATNADGTLSIIDYKTGEPPQDGDEELGYMYQLAIYTYAAEKLTGKKVSKAELHFLQNNSSFAMNRENAFTEAMALAKEIAAKSQESEFKCNLESCKHCGYNYLCKKS